MTDLSFRGELKPAPARGGSEDEGKVLHRAILGTYEMLLANVAAGARGEGQWNWRLPDAPNHGYYYTPKDRLAIYWTLLRNAHIFEFRVRDYVALRRSVDVYTTESVAGARWNPAGMQADGTIRLADDGYPVSTRPIDWGDAGSSEEYVRRIVTAAAAVPYPDRLPFDICYFAWGEGAYLLPYQLAARMRDESLLQRGASGHIHALLVCSNGWAHEVIAIDDPVRGRSLCFSQVHHSERDEVPEHLRGQWVDPFTTQAPWLVTAVVNLVNGHDSATIESGAALFSDRRRFEKLSKLIKHHAVPPPYYVVQLKQQTVNARDLLPVPARTRHAYSYRFDVRGHFRSRIARGTLPLDPQHHQRLLRRGYSVFSAINPPDSAALAVLMKRRLPPPRPNEWVAVKRKFVDAFQKGPADKPYVPSVRRPSRVG